MENERSREHAKSYTRSVFQQSSVGMVSSLAHTTSTPRRIFKVVALILCLSGFLYQSGKFLLVVFQYPTTVGIDILRPEVINVPAFTFCDNNGLNRRIYCKKFPDRCEEPSKEFCKKYEDYCGEKKTLVPRKEFYKPHKSMTLEDMINFNVKMEDFVKVTGDLTENVTGPYLRLRENYELSLMCYSLYDRVNNSLLPFQVKQNKIFREAVNTITINIQPDETFLPGNRPGVLFAIHNPFEAVNPFEIGMFMKTGRVYMISVTMEEEVLLQKPYDTNCVNYTEIWVKKGRTGPRMQEMCRQECLAEISMKCFNCVLPELIFVTNQRYCTEADIDKKEYCTANFDHLIDECSLKCRDDCKRTKFSYTVQERFRVHFNDDGDEVDGLDNTIVVEIYLEGEEIVVLQHSPKYMIVEVFSSIGGFIGCWLGINLLDITDIFEGFFRVIRYFFKKS